MNEKTTQTFGLTERKKFFVQKWRREHWSAYILLLIAYALCIFLAVRSSVLWLVCGTLGVFVGVIWLGNRCAAYVEQHAFDGKGDN